MRIDNDETLAIGRNAVSLNGFDGMIDDVRLYNRVLTPAEILAIAVPEPASLTLLAIPAGVVALHRRWRRGK